MRKMGEGGGAAVFPVVFYDGEREINIGNVRIHPSLEFKTFQSILSQKIGISANQITIYLVDRKKSKFSPENRRKVLITGKASFSAIAREKDCFFLVALKRSRRDRRRKPKQSSAEFGEYFPENTLAPENIFLLRRNQSELTQSELNNPQLSGYVSPYYDQISPSEFVNYSDRLLNLQIQRENYMAMVSHSNAHLGLDSFPRIVDSYAVSPGKTSNRPSCEECANAKKTGQTAPFHFCVYDSITVGFRSPAGPISRPDRASL